MVEVSVADTGSGISETIAPQLFQPFVTTKPAGMGVGLSISKRIIEAHGGRMWAEPNPNGGTVFRFTLEPAADESEAG
jgi:two-component system sensor kinase FixL